MRIRTFLAGALAALTLTACAPVRLPDVGALLAGVTLPAMRWDHLPDAADWTRRSLIALARHDNVLAARVPADIAAWCPGYEKASLQDRRAFWAGLMSATAKYESGWNARASGGGGRYIGLMQISPGTAARHGCDARSTSALKDGGANLECAVEVIARQVGNDGVVAGKGNRGIGRDWMPFRKATKRAEMSAWTRSQSYCQ